MFVYYIYKAWFVNSIYSLCFVFLGVSFCDLLTACYYVTLVRVIKLCVTTPRQGFYARAGRLILSRRCSCLRCEYLLSIPSVLCPVTLAASMSPKPFSNKRLVASWRMSCIRKSGALIAVRASFHACRNCPMVILRMSPLMPRGSSLIASRAALESGVHRHIHCDFLSA